MRPIPPNSHLTTKTMAPKMNPLLLLLTVLTIAYPILSLASAPEDKPKNFTMPLKDICNKVISETDNVKPEFCMSTIQSADDDHHDFDDIDVVTALRLSMKAFFAYAKTTVDHVKQLQDDPKFDLEIKDKLKICHDSYTSAIKEMKKVKEEMKVKLRGLTSGFSVVNSRVVDCTDKLYDRSVMPEYQEKLGQIARINYAIARLVEKQIP